MFLPVRVYSVWFVWMKLLCMYDALRNLESEFPRNSFDIELSNSREIWAHKCTSRSRLKRLPQAIFLGLSDISLPAWCECLAGWMNQAPHPAFFLQYYCLSCADLTSRHTGNSMQLCPLINNAIIYEYGRTARLRCSEADLVVSRKRLRHQPSTHP